MLGKFAGILVVAVSAGSLAAVAQTGGTTGTTPGGAAGMQLSQAECESLWNQADSSGAGSLTQTQAQNYVSDFSRVDSNSDGRISRTEFMQGCNAGNVQRSATTGGATGATGSGTTGGSMGSGSTPKK